MRHRIMLTLPIENFITINHTPVIVDFGQSNIVGNTIVDLPSEYRQPNPNAKIVGVVRDGTGTILSEGYSWEIMDWDIKNWGNKHGHEFPIAKLFETRKCYVIKIAKGGSSLAVDWNKSGGQQYNELITAMNYAKANIPETNLFWLGIWGQYETDSATEAYYTNYSTNLKQLKQNILNDTGIAFNRLVWLQVNKNDGYYPLYTEGYDTISLIQQNERLVDYIVPTDDLTLKDVVHYNSASQITIASRIYNNSVK